METFYAKVDTVNETTYDTKTLSVLDRRGERLTLRIDRGVNIDIGEIYRFYTEPIVFKDKDQLLVKDYRHIANLDLSLSDRESVMKDFYRYAPVDIESVKDRIEQCLDGIENSVIKALTRDIYDRFKDDFYLYPAATKFHHAYIGGLAHHTETMLRLADGVLEVYDFLDRDLLVAGIILHDILKIRELDSYKEPEYSTEGRLIGHITMGVKEIAKTAYDLNLYDTEERLLLEHMMLSHHYYGNFGSPKKPNIPEALALHFIDNIDSKLAVVGEMLKTVNEGEFTSPIPVVDREKIYKARRKK